MKRLLGWICCASLFAVGCNCNVAVPEDVDAGVGGGAAGGVVMGGGSTAGGNAGGGMTAGGAAGGGAAGGATAGGSAGGSAGGDAGGAAGGDAGGSAGGMVMAGGSAGGMVMAGGSAGGMVMAGGSAGGMVMAGGSAGGVVMAGGSAGGIVMGGGAAGGIVMGGGAAGGIVMGGGAAGGIVMGGGAAGGSIGGGSAGGIVMGGGAAGGSIGGGAAGGSVGGGAAGGSIGGGSAGGIVMGGGAAGGSIGGGSAGGSIGGGSAGGGPIDTYVCVTCPGSLDSNPGTQASPFRTIARGIAVAQQLGRPTVFVGSAQGTPTAYAESISVPSGVVVQGRWTVSSTFSWVRTGNRTLLINLTTTGVTFAPGAGRTSGLDGIRVQSAGAISGATTVSAISIVDASPTLRDFEVDPPGGGLPSPVTAAGVSVLGSASSTGRPNPRLEGLTNARSDVQAGAASTNSFGVVVTNASVDTEFLDVRGGNTNTTVPTSPATSAGLFLVDGAGTSFRSSTATAGIASGGTCAGIAAGGDTGNLLIDQSEARGCTGIPNGLNPPVASVGVSFANCTAIGPGSGNPRLTATVVQGGVAQGTNSYVVGVLASNGCPLQIDGNSISGSNAQIIVPQSAAGVICTHELQNGVPGANSSCRIANNRGITGGRAIQASIGLACVGNCATGTASCPGSCTEVFNNSASGQDARLVVHGFVTQSSPRIARNTFGGDGQQCTNSGGSNPFLYGLRLEGSSSRVENNLVIGGVCPSVIAFEQANVRRSGDMSAPAPDVHSNTFVPVTGASGVGMNTLIVGVAVRSQSPAAVFSPMGSYRNNIITALGFAAVRFAFQEADASSDPAVLEHNDFWAPTIAGMPPLYLNEGTTTLNGAGQINGLNGMGVSAFNNLSNDPGFIANFRISNVSPMRAAGGIAGAPFDDIDGQRRPIPVNTAPDIGCDETQ